MFLVEPRRLEQSNLAYGVRTHARAARRLGWIDTHTGLGVSGLGERIFACRDDAAALQRTRQWWGGYGNTPVTSIYDGSSTSERLTALMRMSVDQECPHVVYTGIAMAYGTVPPVQMIETWRAEQWLQIHPEAPAAQAALIKQQMMDAFYRGSDWWKGQIASQAREALFQAVAWLSDTSSGTSSGTSAD